MGGKRTCCAEGPGTVDVSGPLGAAAVVHPTFSADPAISMETASQARDRRPVIKPPGHDRRDRAGWLRAAPTLAAILDKGIRWSRPFKVKASPTGY